MQYLHKHWQLQFRKVNAFSEKFETHFGKCRESIKIRHDSPPPPQTSPTNTYLFPHSNNEDTDTEEI